MWKKWSKKKLPITLEDKTWLEDAFLWFEGKFGKDFLLNQPIVLPTKGFFNWNFKGNDEDAYYIIEQVANLMNADLARINLKFYSEHTQIELAEGLITMSENYNSTLGKYIEHYDGRIEIMIERKQLGNPISLIATIAHEMAHMKLIGEKILEENDEYLTEIAVLIYGFGIFNANTSLAKLNTWSGVSHMGWQVTGGAGYLHYKVHGFALALYSNYRGESNPEWLVYLEKDLQKSFKTSMNYIKDNLEGIRFKS